MKKRILLASSLLAVVIGMTLSCSRSANENGNNRAANAPVATPTPAETPTATPDNQGENVRRLITDFGTALMKGDTDALDKIYSDEYVLVTDTGQVTTKPDRMVMIKSGDLKFDKVDFEEISVRIYGNSAVVVTHAQTGGSFKGVPQNKEQRITFVAVKDGEAWRLVSAQMTPIASEPASGNSKTSGGSNSAPNSSSGNASGSNKP